MSSNLECLQSAIQKGEGEGEGNAATYVQLEKLSRLERCLEAIAYLVRDYQAIELLLQRWLRPSNLLLFMMGPTQAHIVT